VGLIDFKSSVSLARHVVNSGPSGGNGINLPHNKHRCTSLGSRVFQIHTVAPSILVLVRVVY
jgi:hypothetical protein